MNKYISLCILCFSFLLPLHAQAINSDDISLAGTPTTPQSVLFYPNEVQLTIKEKVTPHALPDGAWGVSFLIPETVDKASFFAHHNNEPISGFYWLEDMLDADNFAHFKERTWLPEQETNPERKALLQAVATLRAEISTIKGSILGFERQIELLTPPSTPDSSTPIVPLSAEEREKFVALIGTQLPVLQANFEKAQLLQADLYRRFNRASAALTEFDQKTSLTRVYLPLDAELTASQTITYGYIIPATSYNQYVIQATPKENTIQIEQLAVLYQDSGVQWKNVDVTIATTPRSRSLNPLNLPQWIIQFSHPVTKAPAPAARLDMVMGVAASESSSFANDEVTEKKRQRTAPAQQEGTGFRLWKLGKQDIQTGSPNRISLVTEKYNADFYYVLRPAISAKGILAASISLPKAVEMPKGQAQYFVDSVSIGNVPFEFIGTEQHIFFGEDQLVTAQMKDLLYSKGNQGIISKQQTITWDWELTAKNEHSWPVKAFIEDQTPVSYEADAKLEVLSTPKPEDILADPKTGQGPKYRWATTLAPNEPYIIKHKVILSAPEDKPLYPGRGTK